MTTNINIQNSLSDSLAVATGVAPSLSGSDWGVDATTAPAGKTTQMLHMNRDEGITNGKTWIFTSSCAVAGISVELQEMLTGTALSSDIAVQIVAGTQNTGWQPDNTSLTFTGTDNGIYRITATYFLNGAYDDVTYGIAQVSSGGIMPQIDHVVVLMDENRSLDNLLGWVYANGPAPTQVLPSGSSPSFNGLGTNQQSNSDPNVNGGEPVYASDGTTDWTETGGPVSEWFVPSPDPGEIFNDVTAQLFNGGATADMSGFLTNYLAQLGSNGGPAANAAQIMQSFSPSQVPVISTLATSFAVSDAWYASVPSQTWPNRGFVQTGSSDGNTNNNYLPWNINTIFDACSNQNIDWMVYNDGTLQSLTKTMFLGKYLGNETNFAGIGDFQTACQQPVGAPANQKLPPFSFVEPNFGVLGADESYHPPHDIRPGEQFLAKIYNIIQASPYRDNILFIVLFDEHGGTYDHVVPPSGVQPPEPDPVATDGSGFTFGRLGVRVPAIVVSSYVQPGTVFRSNTSVPLDHTSVLATLRDWLGLSATFDSMLPSPRIAAAPNLAFVLTEGTPQSWPVIPDPSPQEAAALAAIAAPDDDEPLNDVQRSLLIGAAAIVAKRPFTPAETAAAVARLRTHAHGRAWMMALAPHLPLK
jgi:phospholipase C